VVQARLQEHLEQQIQVVEQVVEDNQVVEQLAVQV
jgi:hypothetical protein